MPGALTLWSHGRYAGAESHRSNPRGLGSAAANDMEKLHSCGAHDVAFEWMITFARGARMRGAAIGPMQISELRRRNKNRLSWGWGERPMLAQCGTRGEASTSLSWNIVAISGERTKTPSGHH